MSAEPGHDDMDQESGPDVALRHRFRRQNSLGDQRVVAWDSHGRPSGKHKRGGSVPGRRATLAGSRVVRGCSGPCGLYSMIAARVNPSVLLLELSGKAPRGNGSVTPRGVLTRESESFSPEPALGDHKSGCSSQDPNSRSRNGEFSAPSPKVPKSCGERGETTNAARKAPAAFSVNQSVGESGGSSAKAPRKEHSS